jgi:hypothetical protein
MVIFEETPDSRQNRQVGDLSGIERGESDSRTAIELAVGFQDRRGSAGRFCNRAAIDQKQQLIDPGFAGANQQKSKCERPDSGSDRKGDRVLAPSRGSFDAQALRGGEPDGFANSVFAQPQGDRIADILRSEPAAPLDRAANEVIGDRDVSVGVVAGAGGPTCRGRTRLAVFKTQDLGEILAGSWLSKQRSAVKQDGTNKRSLALAMAPFYVQFVRPA